MNQGEYSIAGPLAAFSYLIRGLKLVFAPGLRRFVLIPLSINLIIYSLGFWLAARYFSVAMSWLIPAWLDWLRWLLWPLFALLLVGAAALTFTLLANLVGSPFYGLIVDAVRKMHASGEIQGSSSRGFLAGFSSETRRLSYFGVRALPILVLFLIPVANVLAPFLWIIFGAWSLSLEYMAYPLEAQGLLFAEQRAVVTQRRLDALAFGGGIMLGLAIPVLNILVPPAAVIGATLYFIDGKAPKSDL